MSIVGVNIGAVSVKVVVLDGEHVEARVENHLGRPREVLEALLAEFPAAEAYGVSGRLGHVSEVTAMQRALEELPERFDAVASLGGESFAIYFLDGARILNVISHNKCAAGSGEFFVQQIGRMGLGIDEAIARAPHGKLVPLASRCSVHCKSDITHKLNRQEASHEDILYSLHDSMANKVVALLEKGQREVKRLLLVGGVSRNQAFVAALRGKLHGIEVVFLPQSATFEAWGTALLTRDRPEHARPTLTLKPTLASLPSLALSAAQVRVHEAPALAPAGDGPYVLGVDPGSTTTKAVLLDAATRRIVASHYGRTSGDPVGATRRCLEALIAAVGNRKVSLVGTTGSGREVIGAFLGTEHIYNEISAHAAGAAEVEAEVDTIFEIGGQDSKYIHLRNGVPIDYAMNSACSAGTGSFLEESAQGDLGIGVSEIAEVALAAQAPVEFKATCAAFINSDIRIALQEGQSAQDIAAGLVYAIAQNYLSKVRGHRPVGRKVFLQGGVAKNRAVAHAFAQLVGREVVIPPNPELLGALGVALLAAKRERRELRPVTDLATLASASMTLRGKFTCGACGLNCTIDRFEVAGRRFPFGGRCSLFENVWKQRARRESAPDLVAERSRIVFAPPRTPAAPGARRIGLPRALTTHTLYPLYANFLAELGYQVVLSEIDPQGELKSNAGFCFPAQIAHGAVLDLERRGIELVFFPHLSRMPNPDHGKDSYLCPITQAGPYFMAKAFPHVRLLTPVLDFGEGYESSTALVDLAVEELGVGPDQARAAYLTAVAAQREAEAAMRKLGSRALARALAGGKPAVVLIGRSYNAMAPEASQSVGKKLASMGVSVIPGDCLGPETRGPTSWHFANTILNAAHVASRHPNLFILYVSNYSCTIDSFTQAMLAAELGAKPYLVLEIDAHTADAGVQTRLEAFLDIVDNYVSRGERPPSAFHMARLGPHGTVVTSAGESLAIGDPRVKLFLPTFSEFHAAALSAAMRWLGLNVGATLTLDRRQLHRGLQYTSGRECLPLPICVGQILEAHDSLKPGEVGGFYMIRGGAPCVADSFLPYFERFICEHELADLFILDPTEENDYAGLGWKQLVDCLSPAVSVADILVEIRESLRVVGEAGAGQELNRLWHAFISAAGTLAEFERALPRFIAALAALPRRRDPTTCPKVVITGDFFTRFSPFFMEGVRELYAARGVILKPVDLNELALYTAYDGLAEAAQGWGLEPSPRATLRACMRAFAPDGKDYLAFWAAYRKVQSSEERLRAAFTSTGLLVAGRNDVSFLFDQAGAHVSTRIFGEIIPSVGKALEADREGYDGVILVGPFNCLPYRVSEAILKPLSLKRGMPILTYESDGYAVSPAFLRQVDVHIQQVLDRHHGRRKTLPLVRPA